MDHLLVHMSRPRQVAEVIVGPILAGALTGLALAYVGWLYTLLALLSLVLGAWAAGSQHRSIKGAVLRGCWSGAVWGLVMLATWHLTGRKATVKPPDPELLQVVIAMVLSALGGSLVWWVLRRRAGAPANARPRSARP